MWSGYVLQNRRAGQAIRQAGVLPCQGKCPWEAVSGLHLTEAPTKRNPALTAAGLSCCHSLCNAKPLLDARLPPAGAWVNDSGRAYSPRLPICSQSPDAPSGHSDGCILGAEHTILPPIADTGQNKKEFRHPLSKTQKKLDNLIPEENKDTDAEPIVQPVAVDLEAQEGAPLALQQEMVQKIEKDAGVALGEDQVGIVRACEDRARRLLEANVVLSRVRHPRSGRAR